MGIEKILYMEDLQNQMLDLENKNCQLEDDNEYLHMKCEIMEVDLMNYHDFLEKLKSLTDSKVNKLLGIDLEKCAEIKPKEIQSLIDESFK